MSYSKIDSYYDMAARSVKYIFILYSDALHIFILIDLIFVQYFYLFFFKKKIIELSILIDKMNSFVVDFNLVDFSSQQFSPNYWSYTKMSEPAFSQGKF